LAGTFQGNAKSCEALDGHLGGANVSNAEISVRAQLYRVSIPDSFATNSNERKLLPIDAADALARFEVQAERTERFIESLVLEATLDSKKLATATPLKSLTESLTRCQFMLEELSDALDEFVAS
jgi:hypothetical protein